jgi:hypothetical protein
LEEFCRSFEGSNMQSTDDQRFLFEKLSEGLYEDMTLMGICMNAIVNWKHNEQELKTERSSVTVPSEQERLYQEKLKDDTNEQHRIQEVSMELNAQLQEAKLELKSREETIRQVEEVHDELTVQLSVSKLIIISH